MAQVESSNGVRAQRAAYRQVGTAMRRALAIVAEQDAPRTARNALLAIFGALASYSKLEDHATRSRLARSVGMSERNLSRGIQWLADHDVIEWIPGGSIPGGVRYPSYVRLLASDHGQNPPPVPGSVTGDRTGADHGQNGRGPVSGTGPLPSSSEEISEGEPGSADKPPASPETARAEVARAREALARRAR